MLRFTLWRPSLPAQYVIALVIALGMTASSKSFVPSAGLGALTPGESHAAITKTGLATIYGEVGVTTVSRSMEQARDTLVESNAAVDKDFENSTAHHCDAENINGCNEVIVRSFDAAVGSVLSNNLDDARKNFGAALHTLQDFYSHSNWIELGNADLHPQIGRPGRVSAISATVYNGAYWRVPDRRLARASQDHVRAGQYGQVCAH
ncbi:MAG: HET-C-related protein [Pseudomonadota bacterium]